MLPPHLSAAHRPVLLHASKPTLLVLRQAPQLTALVIVGTGRSRAPQQRRGCFFVHHRVWSSNLDPDFQRWLGRRQRALKHRHVEALHRKSLWDREPNRPSWVWKLSSSSGVPLREDRRADFRPGERWVSSDGGPPRNEKGDTGGFRGDETRRERMEKRMDEIRRMLDEDPFKALFGYRVRNLGRYPSRTTYEDFNSLLDWGRKSCADIMSRLNARSQGGRNGMEEQARVSWKTDNSEGMEQRKSTSGDAVRPEVGKEAPQATATEEFEFDPITMRRVPKTLKVGADPAYPALYSREQPADAPGKSPDGYGARAPPPLNAVDKEDPIEAETPNSTTAYAGDGHGSGSFTTPAGDSQNPVVADLQKYKAKYSWLEREGFADEKENLTEQPGSHESSPSSRIPRVRDFEIPPEPPSEGRPAATGRPQLRYDTSESRVEDLDLLRPSDVRASAGILKSQGGETAAKNKAQVTGLPENEFHGAVEGEASRADEAEAIKFLRESGGGSNDRRDTMPKGDRVQAVVPDREGGLYDQTPQGFETCYDREVKTQRAIIREAVADGFDKMPQRPETLHARDVETQEQAGRAADTHDNAPQVLQTSLDRHIRAQEAPASEADIYGWNVEHMGLETPRVRKAESEREPMATFRRPESRDELSRESQQPALPPEIEKLPTFQSDGSEPSALKLGSEAQGPESSGAENMQFNPNIANDLDQITSTEGSLRYGFSARGNRNPKLAANRRRRQRERDLIKEIKSIYEDTYGPIDIEHRMKPSPTKSPEDVSPDVQAKNALSEHEQELGPNAYTTTGSDGLEAEILAKPHPQSSHNSGTPAHLSPEQLAMRQEEKEQVLHEEVKEVDDLLHKVQSEFDAIKAKSSRESPHPIVYKILAYDPSTGELTSGTTASSTDSEILPPSEVIPRLTHPAKFLPALTALKKDGYEIVSGGNDVLVFKRVHEGPFIEEEDPIEDDYHHLPSSTLYPYVNPIDGTTTGNFASPTGFVNYDTIFSSPLSDTDAHTQHEPPPAPSQTAARPPSSSPADKIRREEVVFSGQSKWQDDSSSASEGGKPRKGRVAKAAKRVFWVGLWVAGCSYAVGVMGEFFRTGGAEGAGPQWFSGFH